MDYREYRTIDKSTWGDGPWQEEPDKIQFQDDATGLPCLIKRHNEMGHLCGYAGVPEGHPLHGKCAEGEFDVHGGITYGGFCMDGPEDTSICHVPGPDEPDRVWWLGFDMAHYGDLSPGIRALLSDLESAEYHRADVYRTVEYVKEQCVALAAQLADVEGIKRDIGEILSV